MAGRPLRRERIARENCGIRSNPDSKILWRYDPESETYESNTVPNLQVVQTSGGRWVIDDSPNYSGRGVAQPLYDALHTAEKVFNEYQGFKAIDPPEYVSIAELQARHALKNQDAAQYPSLRSWRRRRILGDLKR